jgi:hypothetical protein
MSDPIFDPATLSKLREIHEPMEIRDEMGQLVGYFTPHVGHPARPGLHGDIEVPFTEEELDRFEQEPGGRSLDEILKDLEARS